MIQTPERHLKIGGDPRTFTDYLLLRDELKKLTHPARPDVDWHHAEKLCISQFEHNGIELQTAAWYTLIRSHIAGLTGLNEGLSILEALITLQWGTVWPQPVHARVEILSSLSKRLLQQLRAITLVYPDLSALYQAGKHLTSIGEALQRLELQHQAGLDTLHQLLHSAAVRLEKSGSEIGEFSTVSVETTATDKISAGNTEDVSLRWRWVVQPAPEPQLNVVSPVEAPRVMVEQPQPRSLWKPFVAGVMTALMVGGGILWGMYRLMDNPDQNVLMASVAPVPTALSVDTLKSLRQTTANADLAWFAQAQQQLEQLSSLSPIWPWDYGNGLVRQAQVLWPQRPETAALTQQWQQKLAATAPSPDSLDGWQQGMQQLQKLASRLDGLDGQKGKYMTVSELKSQVFSITQALSRTVPAEEQLRLLAAQPANSPASAALRAQTELHLKQLMVGFSLQNQGEQPATP